MHVIKVPEVFPVYQTVSKEEKTGDIIVKLVNTKEEESKITIRLENCNLTEDATVEVLANEKPEAENSLRDPEDVIPTIRKIKITENYEYVAPANSVSIFRIETIN